MPQLTPYEQSAVSAVPDKLKRLYELQARLNDLERQQQEYESKMAQKSYGGTAYGTSAVLHTMSMESYNRFGKEIEKVKKQISDLQYEVPHADLPKVAQTPTVEETTKPTTSRSMEDVFGDMAYIQKQLANSGYDDASKQRFLDTFLNLRKAGPTLDQETVFNAIIKDFSAFGAPEEETTEEQMPEWMRGTGGYWVVNPDGTREWVADPTGGMTKADKESLNLKREQMRQNWLDRYIDQANNIRQFGLDVAQMGQEFYAGEENRRLQREQTAASMGPRDWLQQYELRGGIGVPAPESQIDWLQYLTNIEEAQGAYGQNKEWREQEAAKRAQMAAGKANYLRALADYEEAAAAKADWMDKVIEMGLKPTDAFGRAVAEYEFGPEPNLPEQPDPFNPQDYVNTAQRNPSWISQRAENIRMAGPETWFNQLNSEQRQKALGLWDATNRWGSNSEGQLARSFAGTRSSPLRTRSKVWGY